MHLIVDSRETMICCIGEGLDVFFLWCDADVCMSLLCQPMQLLNWIVLLFQGDLCFQTILLCLMLPLLGLLFITGHVCHLSYLARYVYAG